jgi:acetolactate synthase-1/2/3 large subunit
MKKLADSFGIEFTETDLDNLSKVLKMRANSNAPGIVLIKDEIYPPKSTSPRWNEQ